VSVLQQPGRVGPLTTLRGQVRLLLCASGLLLGGRSLGRGRGGEGRPVRHGHDPRRDRSVNVTLTAVDTTKSFLVFGVAEAEDQPTTGQVVGRLTSATNVTFLRNSAAGAAITVTWYVAEFSSGVSVQRGTTVVLNDTPVNVAITAVNTARSFPIVTVLSGGTGFDRNDFIRA